ncbi:unnamed protein product [Phaedon cochleariae]|uniref:CCHC-type domain-containing protein n=1 Tax=Phaedon cochleariae TaxID=80249 RepID=A0A9N9SHN2_PHACE|nr:unnamed protein product [Phaedon cochleariae]
MINVDDVRLRARRRGLALGNVARDIKCVGDWFLACLEQLFARGLRGLNLRLTLELFVQLTVEEEDVAFNDMIVAAESWIVLGTCDSCLRRLLRVRNNDGYTRAPSPFSYWENRGIRSVSVEENRFYWVHERHGNDITVFLKLVSNLKMQVILQEFSDGIVKYVGEEGDEFDVFITVDADDIMVKIYDFPLEMDNQTIKEMMSKYGIVKICEEPGHEKRECPKRHLNRIHEIRRPSAPVVDDNEGRLPENIESQLEIPEDQINESKVLNQTEEEEKDERNEEKELELNTSSEEEAEKDSHGDIIPPTPGCWQEFMKKTAGMREEKRQKTGTSSEEERKVPKLTIKLPTKAVTILTNVNGMNKDTSGNHERGEDSKDSEDPGRNANPAVTVINAVNNENAQANVAGPVENDLNTIVGNTRPNGDFNVLRILYDLHKPTNKDVDYIDVYEEMNGGEVLVRGLFRMQANEEIVVRQRSNNGNRVGSLKVFDDDVNATSYRLGNFRQNAVYIIRSVYGSYDEPITLFLYTKSVSGIICKINQNRGVYDRWIGHPYDITIANIERMINVDDVRLRARRRGLALGNVARDIKCVGDWFLACLEQRFARGLRRLNLRLTLELFVQLTVEEEDVAFNDMIVAAESWIVLGTCDSCSRRLLRVINNDGYTRAPSPFSYWENGGIRSVSVEENRFYRVHERHGNDITVDQIVGRQFDHVKHKVFLKLVSNLKMQAILQEFSDGIVKYVGEEGDEFDVFITEDADDIMVEIYDFPLEMDNQTIKEKMSKYGIVESIRNEKYVGDGLFNVETGIRSMWIAMKKPIPSYVAIEGCTSLVTYPNQVRTCLVCEEPGHEKRECPKRPLNRIHEIRRPSAPVVTDNEGRQPENIESQLEIVEDSINESKVLNQTEEEGKDERNEEKEIELNTSSKEEAESDSHGDIIPPTPGCWQEFMKKTAVMRKKKRQKMGTSSEEERKVPKLNIKLPTKAVTILTNVDGMNMDTSGNHERGEILRIARIRFSESVKCKLIGRNANPAVTVNNAVNNENAQANVAGPVENDLNTMVGNTRPNGDFNVLRILYDLHKPTNNDVDYIDVHEEMNGGEVLVHGLFRMQANEEIVVSQRSNNGNRVGSLKVFDDDVNATSYRLACLEQRFARGLRGLNLRLTLELFVQLTIEEEDVAFNDMIVAAESWIVLGTCDFCLRRLLRVRNNDGYTRAPSPFSYWENRGIRSVILKLVSNLKMQAILQEFSDGIVKYVGEEGDEFDVFITVDADDIMVKIYDFPLEMDNQTIKEMMSKYEIVKSIRNEKCVGDGHFNVETGIRSMWIAMKKPIPSYVAIEGCTSLVTYPNQVRTCLVCEEPGHEKRECPKRHLNRIHEIRRPSAPVVDDNEGRLPENIESQLEIPEDQINESKVLNQTEEEEKDEHNEEKELELNTSSEEEAESDSHGDIIPPTPGCWQEFMKKTAGMRKEKRQKTGTSSEEERKVPKLTIKLPTKAVTILTNVNGMNKDTSGNHERGEDSKDSEDPFF